MFGYVIPDKPNMYVKDFYLFRAYYCGLCHSVKHECGQCARFSVNYDVTFISIFFHDLLQVPVKVVKKSCILNPKKREVIEDTPLMRELVRLNLILMGLKLSDDKADGVKKHTLARFVFRGKIKRARRKSPLLAECADTCFKEQQKAEVKGASIDRAGEPFANMMKQVFKVLAEEKSSESIENIGYLLGKYVYVMDALDDYDEDVKKGQFNAFYEMFGAKDYKELLQNKLADIKFVLEDLVRQIEENYKEVSVCQNEGVITNVLWYGLRARADTVLNKEKGKCQKIRL